MLFHIIDDAILAVLLIVYAGFMLLRPSIVVSRQHPFFDAAAGLLGGITGGAVAFPGAFVTIWCGLKDWTKERQRALYQPFILITQIAALLLLVLVHPATGERLSISIESLVFLPSMLLGTSLGLTLFKHLSDRHFAKVVNVLLIMSGLSLLLKTEGRPASGDFSGAAYLKRFMACSWLL